MTTRPTKTWQWLYHAGLAGVLILSLGCLMVEEDEGSNPSDNNTSTNNPTSNNPSTNNPDSNNPPAADCSAPTELANEDINGGVTLTEGSCYRVTSRLTVSDGILTIEPGVVLTFGQGAGLSISDEGRLTATGTSDAPIYFTGEESERGYWLGLRFSKTRSPDNVLDHIVVEHAGGGKWHGGERSQAGIYIESGVALTIRNSTIRNAAKYGLTSDAGDTDLTLEGNLFRDNEVALRLHANQIAGLAEDNTYQGNDGNFVLVDFGDVSKEATWVNPGIPYQFNQTVKVTKALTLTPGTTFEFRQNLGMSIDDTGRLIADASSGDPIVFTGTEGLSGFWKGIRLKKTYSTDNVLKNAVVENAGSSKWHGGARSQAGIYVEGQSYLTIADVTVKGSGRHGLSVDGGAVVNDCDGLQFENNAEEDLFGDGDICGN